MRKTFKFTHPKIKVPRLADAIKHELKKYIKRERKKPLPEGVDFWDFGCKYGPTEAEAKDVHQAELNKCIDKAEAEQLTSFYVEIIAKPRRRTKKPLPKGAIKKPTA